MEKETGWWDVNLDSTLVEGMVDGNRIEPDHGWLTLLESQIIVDMGCGSYAQEKQTCLRSHQTCL